MKKDPIKCPKCNNKIIAKKFEDVLAVGCTNFNWSFDGDLDEYGWKKLGVEIVSVDDL